MVNLSEYKDYCTGLLELIGADELVMVVQEEHLKKRLRDETGPPRLFAASPLRFRSWRRTAARAADRHA